MKDLEKIKSEDLGCQVQDANPGNFGIEQEVGAMVGATVPAPTEPSADDARELGAQLLVFLRRALTPIKSALRTALAAIYAHLDSRCTDYTPAAYDPYSAARRASDPMGSLPARTLPNLLQAITAFAPRKISNGSNVVDGISLAHLLKEGASVTEIIDDNVGWSMNNIQQLFSLFPNITKLSSKANAVRCSLSAWNTSEFKSTYLTDLDLGSVEILEDTSNHSGNGNGYTGWFALPNLQNVNLSSLKRHNGRLFWGGVAPETLDLSSLEYSGSGIAVGVSGVKRIIAGNLKQCPEYSYNPNLIANCPDLEYAYIPNLTSLNWYGTTGAGGTLQNMPKLEELHIGKVAFTSNSYNTVFLTGCDALIKLVIYGDLNQNLYLNSWNPADKGTTFLQNFREHIALRLTDQGSGLTLTLSQAVRDAIHAAEATYGIEAIIVTQKGWTLSPAPTE